MKESDYLQASRFWWAGNKYIYPCIHNIEIVLLYNNVLKFIKTYNGKYNFSFQIYFFKRN